MSNTSILINKLNEIINIFENAELNNQGNRYTITHINSLQKIKTDLMKIHKSENKKEEIKTDEEVKKPEIKTPEKPNFTQNINERNKI
ncbi:hypothetical protein B0W47_02105 [Komagataeibacter nataicola]|uniref:Uncharacterized protein n=3 Tax=Komagataeibacter TaxID=1434011 RepID=A0A9N7C449_9PROT|nr:MULTISPECIES: hypothetical protein [Komagataeibacter]AQU86441.1 hypothetical protein B0W47_02105 [Komagataeibacter nataicola]PYD65874.1 hypothetical protein CDI09_11440 [Komagataeibacter nataicola]PYD80013.1 hypothetical protein CFR77_05755 [Komagataeibacter sucrofermentans]WNM08136.1 hypothetical protein RI056_14655 [Komagataeibacter nataicola]GBQ52329.1 hypothetical protein AA15973_2743 [Komagataeibacter sucrofermentans DSM 15973]